MNDRKTARTEILLAPKELELIKRAAKLRKISAAELFRTSAVKAARDIVIDAFTAEDTAA